MARRNNRGRRRALRIAGWALIDTGIFLLVFAAYQLWGTGLYTASAQEQLASSLEARLGSITTATVLEPLGTVTTSDRAARGTSDTPADSLATTSTTSTVPQLITEQAPDQGEALGWLKIPVADVDHVIVEGVAPDDLKKGPGHMPWTPLPGQPGNSVLSGHRTTYGAPFFDLDLLEEGDRIFVQTASGEHVYEVREILIVEPTDVWVTDPRPGGWLTLTTCTPKYSAAQRLIIVAEMIRGPNLDAISAIFPPPSVPTGTG